MNYYITGTIEYLGYSALIQYIVRQLTGKMAKIFRKTHNPYALCAITYNLTLSRQNYMKVDNIISENR